ncbi:DUF4192 domain-containing protein [Actinoplanes sp. NBRC 103695]|uniref:DUF4192 domain-containing protein n=1 Tax=Actinoplanes sp. NBRC 103695 TaxID=3032202 RepID=UPI0024A56762|nr:DUF4192 domain-containing protein [Actinoplanes sp. NBRC 103695]GLZ00804.1 hypothetical protein Acsp02_80560 [Actinoplanes sp. NBRC 103695]
MIDPSSETIVRNPQDLLGAVPYLLGYHPGGEIVAVYLGAGQRILGVAAEPVRFSADALSGHLLLRAPAEPCAEIALIGYGPPPSRPVLAAIGRSLDLFWPLHALLWVTGSRCVCLLDGCSCPASRGMDIDPTPSPIATRLAVAGKVALPSRQALDTLVAPDLVAQAEAEGALAALAPDGDVPELFEDVLATVLRGHRLTAGQLAPLSLALTHPEVLETAWDAMCACMWQRDLWLDVTRRVPDRYVCGPATLAAWCAWLRGEHALATVACNRAVREGPGGRLTRLVTSVMRTHAPAHRLRRPTSH